MLNNSILEKNYDFFMLIETLQRNGVQCESIDNSDVIKASYQGHDELLVDHVFPYMPLGYANILSDKFYFKQLLTAKNFPVLKGDVFHKNLFDEALAYVNNNNLWPVTVKPPNLSCGDNVFCAIQCEEDFKKIWLNIIQPGESLYYLIEPAWPFCPDYRFAWFYDRDPSVLRRTVPEVIGDGKKDYCRTDRL